LERSKYYSRDEWNVITFTKKQKKVFTTIPFYEISDLRKEVKSIINIFLEEHEYE